MNQASELQKALGISAKSAKLYFAALQLGPRTLTELAREAGLSRTVISNPIRELLENGLLVKQLLGKRIFYHPLNPQNLTLVLEKKKQKLKDIAGELLQQISAFDQDLQIRWFSGNAGIQTAFTDFYTRAKGLAFCHFENVDTFEYIGKDFGESLLKTRIKRGINTKVLALADKNANQWYKGHIARDKEELRETIVVSAEEYPFNANMGASEDMVIIFEYKAKPFAILIENRFVAQSIRSVHRMIWDRYRVIDNR